jgi:hypothetical protein
MVTKEFKSRAIRMHQELEASIWNWLEDKLVYHLEAFPCILVKNIWWVHNSCIFKYYFISLKIYGYADHQFNKGIHGEEKEEERSGLGYVGS